MSRIPILLAFGLTACAQGAETPASAPAKARATAPASAPGTAAAAPAQGGPALVRTHDGAEVLNVAQSSDGAINLVFTASGQKSSLQGVSKDGVKRKYSSGGSVLFETKGDADGFKLRTPTGSLLFKVKFAEDKIKVSDNEENANPFELKAREGDRIKVMAPQEQELGNVRANTVEGPGGKKLFDITGRAGSAAYGVLLLEKLPPAQRYIVFAELYTRGK